MMRIGNVDNWKSWLPSLYRELAQPLGVVKAIRSSKAGLDHSVDPVQNLLTWRGKPKTESHTGPLNNVLRFGTISWKIIEILKQSEAGAKTSELCRQHGISAATFYSWRSMYGGLEVSEAKRLKQPEEENAKLKRIVADQALDITVLKDLVGKKW